ncbi:MAG: peptidylprolyl isomerase [Patescibacteria group bacterium]
MLNELNEKKPEEIKQKNETEPVIPRSRVDVKSILLMVLILLVIFLVGVGVAVYNLQTENKFARAVASTLPYPMAVVDTQLVYLSDYWQELDLVLRACEQVGTNCQIDDADREQVVDRLISEKLWVILAQRHGVSVDENKLNEEYNKVVSDNGGQEQFLKIIVNDFGWTEERFRQKMYLEMLKANLEDALIEKVEASHILITVLADASDEEVEAARQKALEVIGKLNQGEDFAVVATEYSNDPSVSQNNGNLGYFGRGVMVEEFEEAVFSMNVGEISQPVRTDFGWHIIKLEDKKGDVNLSFDDWLIQEKEKMRVWVLI